MVQCAHFAYDDEELSGYFGGAGGCWPLKDEDQEPEDDLLDANDLADVLCFRDKIDPPEPLLDHHWKQSSLREEKKAFPSCSPILESTQIRQNHSWHTG